MFQGLLPGSQAQNLAVTLFHVQYSLERGYRGTSLMKNSAPLGPYNRTMPRALRWAQGRGLFLRSEVTL